ncbi:MAG: 50S ribosomal protein L30 [candidate division WOR-3 bacterium]|nr:50S ribosomal protein L30 [candidate division WOR-3 bacterium]
MSRIRIRLVKSSIGAHKSQKATLRALGLRKTQSTVEKEDNPAVRGMINKVRHLIEIEEIK